MISFNVLAECLNCSCSSTDKRYLSVAGEMTVQEAFEAYNCNSLKGF